MSSPRVVGDPFSPDNPANCSKDGIFSPIKKEAFEQKMRQKLEMLLRKEVKLRRGWEQDWDFYAKITNQTQSTQKYIQQPRFIYKPTGADLNSPAQAVSYYVYEMANANQPAAAEEDSGNSTAAEEPVQRKQKRKKQPQQQQQQPSSEDEEEPVQRKQKRKKKQQQQQPSSEDEEELVQRKKPQQPQQQPSSEDEEELVHVQRSRRKNATIAYGPASLRRRRALADAECERDVALEKLAGVVVDLKAFYMAVNKTKGEKVLILPQAQKVKYIESYNNDIIGSPVWKKPSVGITRQDRMRLLEERLSDLYAEAACNTSKVIRQLSAASRNDRPAIALSLDKKLKTELIHVEGLCPEEAKVVVQLLGWSRLDFGAM